MKRAYKLRPSPTRPQEGRAVRLLADHCELYNAALAERREAWRMRRVSISYGDQSAQLKDIRAEDPQGQGRHWRRVRRQRLDFHHKTARTLVDTYDAFALEDLRITGLTASARGTVEHPGRNVAQKAGLNRSILDAGWGQFTAILTAKAASAGRRVILVNLAFTSIDCPACGEMDADLNGARNIAARAGLGSGQALVA
jgi:IS605 OrfB family transposase